MVTNLEDLDGKIVEGKVVIVTGAAAASVARWRWQWADNGASVVVNDIGASLGGELKKESEDAAQRGVSEIEGSG